MKIIIASDKFKGSLTAEQACGAIAAGVRQACPEAKIQQIPLADGGEGTAGTMVAATGGKMYSARVTGPTGEPVAAQFGIIAGDTAVLEMASAAGLILVPPERRNPLYTTTFGVGELIRAAFDHGGRRFIVGIGGSATNDGGCGMAQALGVKFWDKDGQLITKPLTGGDLDKVGRVDPSGLAPEIRECEFLVACDVTNPLLGPDGATNIYSGQKGAGPAEKQTLEQNLTQIIELIENAAGRKVRNVPGAGAAGGLGAGLLAFLEAKLRRGIELVLEQLDFTAKLRGADLVITGEGRLDDSTLFGKTIWGVARAAKAQNIPLIALAGTIDPVAVDKIHQMGVTACLAISPGPESLEQAMKNAADNLAHTAGEVVRIFKESL